MVCSPISFLFFFFNDTATTEIYTLSLHDALPISSIFCPAHGLRRRVRFPNGPGARIVVGFHDFLNSLSHHTNPEESYEKHEAFVACMDGARRRASGRMRGGAGHVGRARS